MAYKKVKVALVSLKQPCTACLITEGLVREMLKKISSDYNYVEVEHVQLDDLKEVHSIEGLEVENFPALLVNDEQITAGTIPMKKQLISIIEMEGKKHDKN